MEWKDSSPVLETAVSFLWHQLSQEEEWCWLVSWLMWSVWWLLSRAGWVCCCRLCSEQSCRWPRSRRFHAVWNRADVLDQILTNRFFFMIPLKKEVFVQKHSQDWTQAPCELSHCHLKDVCLNRVLLWSNCVKYQKARQAALYSAK